MRERGTRRMMSDLLSGIGSELSERKVLVSGLAVVIAIGLWLLVAHACRSSPSPTLGKETFICTSCNQTSEIEIDLAFVRDKPTKCPHCGKENAWVRATCPHCRQVFSYGQLQEQGSNRAGWKCPKCGAGILGPAKGKARKK